jgi:hypothetical protein
MAREEIYIARLGIWFARAVGDFGSFATDLDTDMLGFQMPEAIVTDIGVKDAGQAVSVASETLLEAADRIDTGLTSGDRGDLVRGFAQLVEGIYFFVDTMQRMVDRIETVAATLPPAESDAVNRFIGLMTRKTIDYQLITLLEQQYLRLVYLLNFLGLIDWRVAQPSGMLNAPRYVRKELHFERLKDLVRDPAAHLAVVHGWGTNDFDPSALMEGLLAFYPEETAIEQGKIGDDAFLEIGPFFWSRDSSISPPGMLLDLSANISQRFDERVEFASQWGMDFRSNLSLEGGAIFRLKPPFDFSVEPKIGTASGAVMFLVNRNATARGFTIIGGNNLLRLTAENVGIGTELIVGASTSGRVTINPGVFAELDALTLSLGSGNTDSFLGSLLADADIEGAFDLGLGWNLDQGLSIKGAGAIEIAIAMHQTLGIARFDTLYLLLKIREDEGFLLETSAGITGLLGPLTATVERIGAEAVITFSDKADANFGLINLDLRFKPPNGVGLSVDAGVVKGGGYLYFDFDREEYAGALELTFSEFLSLKAIGLITTRMPDGSKGFSLLIIITAEFGTGIQLGYGFTLLGVGGLLGLNRTMRLQPLAEGIRTGSINGILFPRDVIANAPRIISDLRTIFPPEEGKFLIGPMAKLGWGTPTLISLSLGIIIEIPGNIAILGVLQVALPTVEAPLIVLQVNFLGAIEFDKKRVWFFASLFESRILFMTLEGEMGLLVAFGDDANFVVTVGGFHPQFAPPPLPFPSPVRVAVNILNESNARIRVMNYFAVTSNTAQIGAHAELFFGFSDFSVEGHIGFDALIQFSPFHFIIEVSASVALKAFGAGLFSIRLRFSLEGPTPWRARGTGSISILFFEISADFDRTWGEERDTTLPPIDVMPLLKAEFEKIQNWRAILPAANNLLVTLRKLDSAEDTLVLHPVGVLKISQKAIPLDLPIDKVGNQKTNDAKQLSVGVTSLGLGKNDAREQFAIAQFQDMDDASKLSRPAYEPQHSGLELSVAGQQLASSKMVKRVIRYEEIIIDSNFKRFARSFSILVGSLFGHFLAGASVSKSVLSQSHREKLQPFTEKITVQPDSYVVAFQSTNQLINNEATFASQASANCYMQQQLAIDPSMTDALHVIPSHEVTV